MGVHEESGVVQGVPFETPRRVGPAYKENRDEKGTDIRGRDTRPRGGFDRGLCRATGDEYRSGERTLSARVHQGGRPDPSQELALVGIRGLAVDSRWLERQ